MSMNLEKRKEQLCKKTCEIRNAWTDLEADVTLYMKKLDSAVSALHKEIDAVDFLNLYPVILQKLDGVLNFFVRVNCEFDLITHGSASSKVSLNNLNVPSCVSVPAVARNDTQNEIIFVSTPDLKNDGNLELENNYVEVFNHIVDTTDVFENTDPSIEQSEYSLPWSDTFSESDSKLPNGHLQGNATCVLAETNFPDTDLNDFVENEECITKIEEKFNDVHFIKARISHNVLEPDQVLEMTYCHGDSPWNFWLCYYPLSDLNHIRASIRHKYYANMLESVSTVPEIGDFVIVADGERFFRGQVLNTKLAESNEDTSLMIIDIDSGRMKSYKLKCVRSLTRDMENINAQAINCQLYNITNKSSLWKKENLKSCNVLFKFKELLQNASLSVKIVEKLTAFSFPKYIVDVDALSLETNIITNVSEFVHQEIITALENLDDVEVKATDSPCENSTVESRSNISQEIYESDSCHVPCEVNAHSADFLNPTAHHTLIGCNKVHDLANEAENVARKNVLCDDSVAENSDESIFFSEKSHLKPSLFESSILVSDHKKYAANTVDVKLCDSFIHEASSTILQTANYAGKQSLDKTSSSEANDAGKQSLKKTSSSETTRDCEEFTLTKYRPCEDIPLIKNRSDFLVGQVMLGIPHYIESPSSFYVQVVTSGEDELTKLNEQMNRFYSKKRVDLLTKESAIQFVNSYCAALLSDYNQWLRAEVKDWMCKSDSLVKLLLVDYGEEVSIPFNRIQPLAQEFTVLPVFAQKCHLYCIAPSGSNSCKYDDHLWPPEALDVFRNMCELDKIYNLHIMEMCGKGSAGVIIVDPQCVNISINQQLISAGHAALLNEECGLNIWDPMKEDYESKSHDDEDACIAVSGYSPQDEKRVCKFFSRDGKCFKGSRCRKEHIIPNPSYWTTDQREEYHCAFSQIILPAEGDFVPLHVTNIVGLNLFYCVLYFDVQSEDEETLLTLNAYINRSENIRNMRNFSVTPSVNQIVLAHYSEDGVWYRARVLDTDNDNDLVQVFYVDYGNSEWVSEKFIREIEPQYLHLPFQAIESSLANAEIIEDATKDIRESAVKCFRYITDLAEPLQAKVVSRDDYLQKLELQLFDNERRDIAEMLAEMGYARITSSNSDVATGNFFPG